MAELKTKPTGKSVSEFLNGVDQRRQKDCTSIIALMQRATKGKPRMSVLYIGRLADVDLDVVGQLIQRSVTEPGERAS